MHMNTIKERHVCIDVQTVTYIGGWALGLAPSFGLTLFWATSLAVATFLEKKTVII